MRGRVSAVMVLVALSMSLLPAGIVLADDVPRISKEELRSLLNNPDIAILDARLVIDWRKSGSRIPGAVRVDPNDVSSWAGDYDRDRRIVVYCA